MSGRHRNSNRKRSLKGIAIALVAVITVAGGAAGAYRYLKGRPSSCSEKVGLTVSAAPEIAPAVRAAADRVTEKGMDVDGACVAITVTAADPADVASAIAGRHGVTLTGVGQPNGSITLPDVWIPDSSTWLGRLATAAPTFADSGATGGAEPIARSPVVLAMPEPVAAGLGWPAKQPTWANLLQKMISDSKLHVGIVEPSRDAAGLSGLLALGAAAGTAPDAGAATTGALRALAAGRSALRQDVLARFPRSSDATAVASSLGVAPLSEQAVISYNQAKPPVPLAAVYPQPSPPALDYPFTVLSGSNLVRASAAGRLKAALGEPEFRADLAAAGLRNSDGSAGTGFAAPKGAPDDPTAQSSQSPSAASAITSASVDRILSTWAAVTMPSRMLAVIDVSGSMLERVPTAGGATRAQVTLEAARRGLGLFDDSWAVGLWIFSTQLEGTRDYRQLAPIAPLSSQRGRLLGQLAGIEPVPQGDTGLYDTVLAAYEAVKKDWDPGRVNSVVLMTDGDNDDADGVSLAQLKEKLRQSADPDRPIQVVIIGIGDGVNPAPLKEITGITGGGVFVAEDPAKIGDIFLKAISLRAAR